MQCHFKRSDICLSSVHDNYLAKTLPPFEELLNKCLLISFQSFSGSQIKVEDMLDIEE